MANEDITPTLEQLRCTKCNLYLSVGPVRLNKEDYYCGRCTDVEGCIIKIYNVVAQSFLFPCRYEESGCKEKFPYGKMELHESLCDKQPFFCPSLKKCDWQGLRKNMRKHYLQEHADDIIENNKVIIVGLKENHERCVLCVCGTSIYFVDLAFDVEFGLKFSVMQCGFEDGHNKYNMKFFNEDNSKALCLNSHNASFYIKKRNEDLTKTEILKINMLDYFECDELRLELSFPSVEDNDPLKVLECPVCIEYMLPPIYFCDKGHSFCHTCTKKIDICSFCKSRFTTRRNYALENFADMAYPKCRNSRLGCSFRSNLEEVKLHESSCDRYLCPLLTFDDVEDENETRICKWYGTFDEMVAHTLSAHSCAEKDYFSGTCNVHLDKESIFLLYTYGFIFKLSSKTIERNRLQFNAQFVGPKDKVNDFDLFTEFGLERNKLVYKQACQLMGDKKDSFEECLTIPYEVLVPYIENDGIVRVSVRIVNVVDRVDN